MPSPTGGHRPDLHGSDDHQVAAELASGTTHTGGPEETDGLNARLLTLTEHTSPVA